MASNSLGLPLCTGRKLCKAYANLKYSHWPSACAADSIVQIHLYILNAGERKKGENKSQSQGGSNDGGNLNAKGRRLWLLNVGCWMLPDAINSKSNGGTTKQIGAASIMRPS